MTSAPSRLLPSNGNRLLVLLLTVSLLSSCGIFRKTPSDTSRPRRTPPVAEAPPKKEVPMPEVKEPPAPPKPTVYNITYMLPFNTDAIPFDSVGNVTRRLSEQTRIALDYYRGALMALDTIQQAGVKLKVHVFDTAEDTAKVASLFNRPEVQQSHLVVGPVYPTQLETASRLARQKKIHMVSPFSTVNSFVERNPYYILANASLPSHCELLYDFAVEQHKPTRVLLLYNETENEQQYASFIQKREDRMRYGVSLMHLTDQSEVTFDQIEEMLVEGQPNVIFIPSTNETFVANMVRKLSAVADKYNVFVYGMPQWRDSRSLRADFLSRVNCRITAAMWFDKNNAEIKSFSARYTARYGSEPSEFALEGYNQTLFFASYMAAQGPSFDKTLSDYTMHTAGESFRFQHIQRKDQHAVTTTTGPFDYIENRSVQILEYRNGRLVKLR